MDQEYFESHRARLVEAIERQLSEFAHNIQILSDVMQQVVAVGEEYVEMDQLWAPPGPASTSAD